MEESLTITESLLRMGRISRHIPGLRGVALLCRFYKAVLPVPKNWTLRIDDFDGDLKMDVDPRETIGVNIWHRPSVYEKREREIFCAAIAPGSVVLDVGANVGIYTLLAAKRRARVFSIEADPRNAAFLRRHIGINGLEERVSVFQMAALDSPRDVTLYRNDINSGMSNVFAGVDGVTVPGRTIDSLDLPPIDVCKMDIEGAEILALRGMADTIKRSCGLRMLIEYAEQHGSTGEIVEFLRSHFRFIAIAGQGILRKDVRPPKYCNLWASEPF